MKAIIKLGGSLVTHKDRPFSPRKKVIKRIAMEISNAIKEGVKPIIVHGGGSFGHYAASQNIKEKGKLTIDGIPKIIYSMQTLNQIILQALVNHNVPAIPFPPHTFCRVSCKRKIIECNYDSVINSYNKGLVPVLYGDIIVPENRVCDPLILSGDDIVLDLARKITPSIVVYSMDVGGIYSGGLREKRVIKRIKVTKKGVLREKASSTNNVYDVTHGFIGKLKKVEEFILETKNARILFVSGLRPNNIYRSLKGDTRVGTLVTA